LILQTEPKRTAIEYPLAETCECLIAFGSNSGDGHSIFQATTDRFHRETEIEIVAISQLIVTPPVGGPSNQPDFLNAVFRLSTSLNAQDLHDLLKSMELEAGRVGRIRWSPRSLDLDLLLHGSSTIQSKNLVVPHPRMTFRRFVLEPAAEIAAEMRHPVTGETLGGLLNHLNVFPNHLTWVANQPERLQESCRRILAKANSGCGNWQSNRQENTDLTFSRETTNSEDWSLTVVNQLHDFQANLPKTKLLIWSPNSPAELRNTHFRGPQLDLSLTSSADWGTCDYVEDNGKWLHHAEIEVNAAIEGMASF